MTGSPASSASSPPVASPASSPPEPLAADEIARLARWPRRLRAVFAIGVALVVAWIGGLIAGDPPWQPVLVSVATGVLVIAGVAAQIGLRCPRCGRPVPFRPGFSLPGRCPRCGVALTR